MEYFAKRNLFNNNRGRPLLLNDISYNQKYSKNVSRIVPSYSGNPNLMNNQKEKTYAPRNHYLTKKNQPININEAINSKYKINTNINNRKVSIDYAQYSKYERPTNNYNYFINNINHNINNNFNNANISLKSSPNKIENPNMNLNNQQTFNLRSKFWDLSNSRQKKAISKNFSMEYLPIKNKYNFSFSKKKLILDLDETLVHSGFNPFTRQSDITLQINVDGKFHTINVLKRPFVDEFLKEISNFFEIYIFTASMEEYASPVIDLMNKNNIVKGKFFRQDCIFSDGLYIKDLYKVSNDLKDVIIIDNNPSSYITNEDNGIPIKTWYEDLNDNELIKLIPLLKYLSNVDDVRNIIRQIVDKRNNEVDFDIVDKIISGNEINDINTNKYNNNTSIKNYNINNNNISSNNINNNRRYGNTFYHEINESKKNKEMNYNYNSDGYNRYEKYNNINSFSNMSYNEIQNEEGHLNNNYNNNYNDINYMQRNQNQNTYKPHFYYENNYNDNNPLLKSSYYPMNKSNNENNENLHRYTSFKSKENLLNLNYDEDLRNNRPFTPDINNRKLNNFLINENNNDNNNNNNNENNNNNNNNDKFFNTQNKIQENEQEIKNYYENIIYNQNEDQDKKIYKNNSYFKFNTQNILNRSSSDIYENLKRNSYNINNNNNINSNNNNMNLRKYNYLLNMNNISNLNNLNNMNEKRNETETNNLNNIKNDLDNDYYLQSYKKNFSRTNYFPKEYNNQNENNNNDINNTTQIQRQSNSNINMNNSVNLNYLNRSNNNYLNYLDDYKIDNLNVNKNLYEKNFQKYNFYKINNINNINKNNNINNNDFFDDVYDSKKPTNSLFNNFRDFVIDKKREFIKEEDKSKNLENPEKFNKKTDNFKNNDYIGKNIIRNFNSTNKKNYFERTNLQNLIDVYKSKFKALEGFINSNKKKPGLNKTFTVNKKY